MNRLLIDRDFEAGDEPVKLCLRERRAGAELRKQLMADLQYDTIGESVGFFRFQEHTARRLAEIVEVTWRFGPRQDAAREAVRDLLLETLAQSQPPVRYRPT